MSFATNERQAEFDMEIGICKYCLKRKDLVESHLLPRALYGQIGANGHFIVQSADEVKYSTAQLKTPLLCAECDNSFNKDGENWTLPLLAAKNGQFAFCDLLGKRQPKHTETNVITYAAAENPDIDVKRLTHFALGVFWKASVHSWQTDVQIHLGPYGEQIRQFLRGEGAFPRYVALAVHVQQPPVKHVSFSSPFLGNRTDFRTYTLYVPGVIFILSVGKQIGNMKEVCFYSNGDHPIFVCDFSKHIESALQRLTERARISQRVREAYFNRGKNSSKT